MPNNNYAIAITFLATTTFTFIIGGSLKILDSSLLYNAGLSSFAYMLILAGLYPKKKSLSHYLYIMIGVIIILLISFVYFSMLLQIISNI